MIESYPLYWPDGWKRTSYYGRKSNKQFIKSFAVSRDQLLHEVSMLGGRNVILSTNIPLRNDGLPYANFKEPQDPGVAIYFHHKDRPTCFACDKYQYVRENIRAISLTIGALRGIERWGASDMMERAFRGFTAIPDRSNDWRQILEFSPGYKPTSEEIDNAFRRLAKTYHPDMHGGSTNKMQDLVNAREQARKAVG